MIQGTDAGPEQDSETGTYMLFGESLYMRAHIFTYAVIYQQHEGLDGGVRLMGSRRRLLFLYVRYNSIFQSIH
jgi:hypothetical protein